MSTRSRIGNRGCVRAFALLLGLSAVAGGLFSQSLSFQRQDLIAGDAPASIVAADFNGDGNADLAVAGSAGLSVLLGNGDGTFQPPLSLDLPPSPSFSDPASVNFNFAKRHLVVADFNGDGKLDLA